MYRRGTYFRARRERQKNQETRSREYNRLALYVISLAGGGVPIGLTLFELSDQSLRDITNLVVFGFLLLGAAVASVLGSFALLFQKWSGNAARQSEDDLSSRANVVKWAIAGLVVEILSIVAVGSHWWWNSLTSRVG